MCVCIRVRITNDVDIPDSHVRIAIPGHIVKVLLGCSGLYIDPRRHGTQHLISFMARRKRLTS